MNAHLEQLEPTALWQHFRTFCDTPRPSWHEEAILVQIEAWADEHGLARERDGADNLCIRKPATPGHENAPGVVLQAHVDMVAEADAGVEHDFRQDPIATQIEDGWLTARGTTLGADNGIGAAAALAILSADIDHGPLEILLTVAEEASLVGASRLAPDWLQGRLLLNLDSEEAGTVTTGCAGGANVGTQTELDMQPLETSDAVIEIGIDGLKGGHSGLDIASGRASANRLLPRVLHELLDYNPRLVRYDGGRMDNAITRAASAVIALPAALDRDIESRLRSLESTFRSELAGVDEGVTLKHRPDTADQALSRPDSRRLIKLLHALPFGVERMSSALPGVPETSNNLGVLRVADGVFNAQLMVRSLVDSARDALVDRIAAMFEMAGFPARRHHGYPGWTPNPDSELLAQFIDIHARVTGDKPAVMVLHAGLECGLIGAKYPHMDMISFGPTIRGAHSPTERVDVATVEQFYQLLCATITALAQD